VFQLTRRMLHRKPGTLFSRIGSSRWFGICHWSSKIQGRRLAASAPNVATSTVASLITRLPPLLTCCQGPQGRTPAPTAKNAEPSPTSGFGEQPSSQSPLNRVCKPEARCIALAAWHGHHSALAPGQLHAWCPRCRLLSILIARRHFIVSFPIYT
jgi:hypothetical protein